MGHAGLYGKLHADVDLERYGRAQGIRVKEVEGAVNDVLSDHRACVAVDELHRRFSFFDC